MSQIANVFKATIIRKQMMALTGLGLCGFVLIHMAGNMLIFVGPEAYNTYSHKLVTNPFIYIAEAGLLFLFVLHVLLALGLTVLNKVARSDRYARSTNGEKGVSISSKTMIYQGLLILVFVVYHLITFKFGHEYFVTYHGEEMRDIFRLVIEVFQSPQYVAWYIVCLLGLGMHLSHGFASSLQTFGLNHPRYNFGIKVASWTYTVIVTGGFISQPIYVFFCL
jgi:succinate dehydrogenase / fumarate reductase cytochrome b subunit